MISRTAISHQVEGNPDEPPLDDPPLSSSWMLRVVFGATSHFSLRPDFKHSIPSSSQREDHTSINCLYRKHLGIMGFIQFC